MQNTVIYDLQSISWATERWLTRSLGPVVRINPNEVHISDPQVFHEYVPIEARHVCADTDRPRIYKQNTAFTKDPAVYSLGISNAMTMTVPVAAHKAKRQTLEPCFSKRRVNDLEGLLCTEFDRVVNKIKSYESRGEEVPIQDLFYCYTASCPSSTSLKTQQLTDCRAM
jgi:hypothetical protein